MIEPVQLRYVWTLDDHRAAYRWHTNRKSRPTFRRLLWVMAVLFTVVGTLQLHDNGAFFPGGFILIAGLNVFFVRLVLSPWLVRREYARLPRESADLEWQISEDGVRIESPASRSECQWNAFASVVQTSEGFLFYVNQKIFHWVPLRAFSREGDFERLAALAEKCAPTFRRIF